MRFSRALIPTVKEAPKDAITPSHILLLRGGFIRPVGAGLYELLPLGVRVLRKIEAIVRREMDRSGAQEVLLPALLPAEYFKLSGRWETFGDTLLRLKDRKGGDYHLGPTHEEIITDLVRREVRSYRQLPLNLYQIQTKFRDEARPRAGLLRCREFSMKDAYSFDLDEAGAEASYEQMREAYQRIFDAIGLEYRIVAADSGAMGGSKSAEFQILAQHGEDQIVACTACDYAANVEVASAALKEAPKAAPALAEVEKIHTPGVGGIDDVVRHLKGEIRAEQMLKCIVYMTQGQPLMAVVRGDREVSEIKLAAALGASDLRLASPAEVQAATGAALGFAGPVGFQGRILVDREVPQVSNAVTGANESDHHLRNVNFGRDFEAPLADIRTVGEGDACPRCAAPLSTYRAIEGGHIFVLGTHYSERMGATYLSDKGEERPFVMGCYGIGISRMIAAAVEQHHDEAGLAWPMSIAPYQVILTPLGKEAEVHREATAIYEALRARQVEVLFDERDERPGVKFKDADLLGIPLRLVVGAKSLQNRMVELKERQHSESRLISIDRCVEEICAYIAEKLNSPSESAKG